MRDFWVNNTGFAWAAGGILAVLLAVACRPDNPPFRDDETRTFADGLVVDGRTLNLGRRAYMRYCYACHGEKGDGKGPASRGLRPPPRDFTAGIFKFARMRTGDDVPRDEDLLRIVKGGLHGTGMLSWEIPDDELARIVVFIKTFAPARWEKKTRGFDPVKAIPADTWPADPWQGREKEAIREGKLVYHLKAQCVSCHPGYETKVDLYALGPETRSQVEGLRDRYHEPVIQESSDYGVPVMPPDFTFSPLRSIRQGHAPEDLFRVVSYGVYPVMPPWKGVLSDADLWALAHYLQSLIALRDTPELAALKARLAGQTVL